MTRRPSRQKYHAVPTVVDGRRFASKREADRYVQLAMAEKVGAISALECQPLYHFEVNGVVVGRYRPDFRYVDARTGELIVEDVKGFRVRDWARTRKLMLACHGITVREIT